MRRITLLFSFIFLLCISGVQGQADDYPISWSLNLKNSPSTVVLGPLDLFDVVQEDMLNDKDKSQPYRYGIERFVNLNMWEHGHWTELPDGGKIWQLVIHSPEAINLSVNFDNFYLPAGSKLQLYSEDRSDITNTFTSLQNHATNQLGTWFIEGDTVWIEYYQPEAVQEMPNLEVYSIIHGYRLGRVNAFLDGEWGFNDSGACHYDVNCSIGADFDSKKDELKKAVALLNLGNGYLCTAALINNAKGDKTPYLLTANHCLENSSPSYWSVRFNWISPDPICGTGDDSGDLNINYTLSGAELRANNRNSDFALVELSNTIPGSWDVAFAGWDNSDTNPLYEVGIHHPQGDIMKVCRDDSGAQKANANGTEVWLIGGGQQGWGDGWEIGTTEAGSSGSPLFNEEGKIIGQLYAGQAACDGTDSNHDYDIYGRFGVSWDAGNDASSRLRDWLDPNNTGLSSVETLQNILSVPDYELTGELKIYPNPTSTEITILNSRFPHLTFELYNIVGQLIHSGNASNTINTISLDGLVEGVYMLRLTDLDTQDSMTRKIVVKR